MENNDSLGSWKAIAAYLNRDVTTVQRWEKREGMPVHRHIHDKRGSVYAFRSELDAWMRDRRPQLKDEPPQPSRWVKWVVGCAALALAIVGIALWQFYGTETAPRDAFSEARITPLTDFAGRELAAAMSRDGKFVAFLSDRGGAMDVWVTQVGTGQFTNLTQGRAPELYNPEVRSVAFTPDGSQVTFWTRTPDAPEPVNVWSVPTLGGTLREYLPGAVEVDWSRDGSRLVFHSAAPGDPTFVADANGGAPRQIHVAPPGTHSHYPVWSPDDRHIYFVRGVPPDRMDLWRMKPDGSEATRLTSHDAWVGHPTFVDERRLVYLASTEEGSGPWLFELDVKEGRSRRIGFGVEQYSSLAASADRSKWVATVEQARTSLWTARIADRAVEDAGATRVDLPTVGGHAPRFGPNYLLFVSVKNDGHGIWMLRNGEASELWSAPRTQVIGGPAISPDGGRIAFTAESRDGTRLYLLDQKSPARAIAAGLQVRGAPAWSPDGRFLAVAAIGEGGSPRLYKVSLDGSPPVELHTDHALNPAWSNDGKFLVYSGADLGPGFSLRAINADGSPRALPEITLSRAARRVRFHPRRNALVVLLGEMRFGNLWLIDLDTGERQALTNFGRESSIRDFDVSPDGAEMVFDRRQENSDVAVIELAGTSRAVN
jgi:Tol biopolymer transport system component